jgi:peptidoglycan-N-acetylglucosamine deacetylase
MPLTVTFDLEDSRHSAFQEERFARMSDRFLDFVQARGIRITAFVVGEIARSHPALVKRIAEDGHEVALHGMRHVALGEIGPARLPRELRDGRRLLEDVAQAPVRGFRAPIFSLTPRTVWAIEQIADAGFQYTSSVLPAANPLHGWPDAPRRPFRWSNGLLELPCPVAGLGRAQIPFLGGVYLRFVPSLLARRLLGRLDSAAVPWSYSHPYDIDPEEPFFVMPHAGWLTSRILHLRRGATLQRLHTAIEAAGGPAPPLGEIARELLAGDPPAVFRG